MSNIHPLLLTSPPFSFPQMLLIPIEDIQRETETHRCYAFQATACPASTLQDTYTCRSCSRHRCYAFQARPACLVRRVGCSNVQQHVLYQLSFQARACLVRRGTACPTSTLMHSKTQATGACLVRQGAAASPASILISEHSKTRTHVDPAQAIADTSHVYI